MDIDVSKLTEEQKQDLQLFLKRIAKRKFYSIEPYPWQERFMNAGKDNEERALVAGNRTGKTFSAAYEVACHLTGEYPDWWDGFRVERPVLVWASSLTNETSRDIVQKELLGDVHMIGTGMIPGDKIRRYTYRQAGIQGVVDQCTVNGRYGVSTLQFKTAEQGWQKFQGTAPDFIWMDEEPDDFRIFTECLTRILTSKGRLMLTYTPLKGETPLFQHFSEGGQGVYIQNATWDDAEHLSEDDKARFLASYPAHERDTRSKGLPMMGEGAIFPFADEDLEIAPFKIPDHYHRICGIDFGINHPAAGVWLAIDPDTDVVYVYHCYKKDNEIASYHASIINKQGDWIPVAWPHDGLNSEKSGGKNIAEWYVDEGVNMLNMSARYEDERGGSQPIEPIIMEMYNRMSENRIRVFSHLTEWFGEKRGMYRKNNKVKALNDDIMKATFYALMMKRKAIPEYLSRPLPQRKEQPIFSTR